MKKLFIISLILFGVICSIAVASSSNDNSLTKSNLNLVKSSSSIYSGPANGLSGGYSSGSSIKVCQY